MIFCDIDERKEILRIEKSFLEFQVIYWHPNGLSQTNILTSTCTLDEIQAS